MDKKLGDLLAPVWGTTQAKIDSVIAGGAIVSPVLLIWLRTVSEIAAEFLPIVGLVLVLIRCWKEWRK